MKYNIPELPDIYRVRLDAPDMDGWPLQVSIRKDDFHYRYVALVHRASKTGMLYANGGQQITWEQQFDSVQDAIDVVCQRLMLGMFE
jgi:hypothetical protein